MHIMADPYTLNLFGGHALVKAMTCAWSYDTRDWADEDT